jgi:hypothetical protein
MCRPWRDEHVEAKSATTQRPHGIGLDRESPRILDARKNRVSDNLSDAVAGRKLSLTPFLP